MKTTVIIFIILKFKKPLPPIPTWNTKQISIHHSNFYSPTVQTSHPDFFNVGCGSVRPEIDSPAFELKKFLKKINTPQA